MPTVVTTKTFRWYNGGTQVLTKVTASDLLAILVAGLNGLTGAVRLITGFRVRGVDIYFAHLGSSTNGFVPSPTLEWEAGSAALTEEGKVISLSSVVSVRDVGGHIHLSPQKNTPQGFWYNDSAQGDIFSVNVPSGMSCVLDVHLDLTFSDGANVAGGITLGGAAPFTGVFQRALTSWVTVGYTQAP